MTMPVLVLDGHSRAALETLQSLGRAGIEVDIAAESLDCLAMYSRYATNQLLQPSQANGAFQQWLRDQDRVRGYELIVPATEASLRGLRVLDEEDPLRRKAVLPSNYALDIAINKEQTCALAAHLDIPVPHGRLISSLDEIGSAANFPVVLKPVCSKVMMQGELRTLAVAVVRTEEQRRQQLRQWLPFTSVLEQQYVTGKGVGAEFLFDRGRKVWHFVHERVHEYPLSGGASSYRKSISPPDKMLADAEKLLTALNWHGVGMVEFKMDSGGQHWVMEINPRFWGSLALAIDAGVDFPSGLLSIARGQTPAAQPNYQTNFYTRDLRTDMEWFKGNLRADPRDPLLLTRPRVTPFLELLRPVLGRESWDHFDWRDLPVTWRIITQVIQAQVQPIMRRLRPPRSSRNWYRHHRGVLNNVSRHPIRKIGLICLGNICRSPLAAKLAEQQLTAVEIVSGGSYPKPGRPSPEKIIQIAHDFGIDLAQHRSRIADAQLLGDADLILVMDIANMQQMEMSFPQLLPRTTFLGLFAERPQLNIADPYAAGDPETLRICVQIRNAVSGLAAFVNRTRHVTSAAQDAATATPVSPFSSTP
jgi:protein-tyrosine-phosphatase/predicted ATP-grasp superfamily ATP-dependent carboligase